MSNVAFGDRPLAPRAGESPARRWRPAQLPHPLALGTLVLLLLVVGGPMATVVWMSLRRGLPGQASPLVLTNYANLVTDRYFLETIGNTLIFGTLTLLVTFTFLIPLTFLLTRCDVPFRQGFVVLLSTVILVPTFLRAIGWIFLLSPEIGVINRLLMGLFGLEQAPFSIYSMAGMAFIQGLSFVPAGYFMLSAAYRAMDPALEEAAYTSGLGKLRTFFRINVPITTPALLGVFVYLLMTAISVFEAPAIIGIPARIFVLSSVIYLNVQPTMGLPDYGLAGAYGVIMLALGLLLSYFYFRTVRESRRYVVMSGRGYRPKTIRLGKWRPVAFGFIVLFFLFEVGMPVGMLVWASVTPYLMAPTLDALPQLTLANYASTVQILQPRTVMNTIMLVVLAPMAALLLSILVSWIVTRTRSRVRGVVDVLAFLPHAVPSILFAVALMYLALLLRPWVPLYGSVIVIVLAHAVAYLAFGSRTLNAAMIQVHRELEEAGRLSGLSALGTLRRIVVPLVATAVVYSWFWVALLSYREVTMALVLYSQTNDVLSTLIWVWWREGKVGEVAALGTLLVGALVLLVAVGGLIYKRALLTRAASAERSAAL